MLIGLEFTFKLHTYVRTHALCRSLYSSVISKLCRSLYPIVIFKLCRSLYSSVIFKLRSLPLVVVMFYNDYTKQRILFHYFSGSKASIGFKAVSKFLLRICSFTVCFWCFEAVEDNSACQKKFKSLTSGHLIHCNRRLLEINGILRHKIHISYVGLLKGS